MLEAETLSAIATQPVPGASPCGESLRYDELWATLEAEIGKLDNLAGGDVDWRSVEQGAVSLLSGRGKDVLLMSWLVRAMWQRDGMVGLAAGLEAYRDLLATFWEGIHPQRVRARRGAIEWLSEKLAPTLTEQAVRGYPEETTRCQAAIAAINAWGGERFDGEDAGLSALNSRLRELSAGAGEGGEAAAAAATDGEAAPVDGDVAVAAVAAVAGKGASAGPIANRAQAVARIRELGDWFARHEPHSPIVPLLRRAEQWSRMDFQTVFAELLKNRPDALAQLWDVLGVIDPAAQQQ